MFRSQDVKKSNNNGMENEENYDFVGATLKIAPGKSDLNGGNGNTVDNEEKGAVLSGLPSPVHQSSTASPETETIYVKKPVPQTKPSIGSPAHFFSFRSGQLEYAINECLNILLKPINDTNILGSWLLTEISHWDHERERVYILTSKSLLEVKYDFIALRILHHVRVRLEQVDTIIKGKISYPQSSLVPQIEGLTNGVTSLISATIFSSRIQNAENSTSNTNNPQPRRNSLTIAHRFDFKSFNPVVRNDHGIRIMWNRGKPISLLTSWNPFASEIPWKTIKDHPLFDYVDIYNSVNINETLDQNRQSYSVDNFYETISSALSDTSLENRCKFENGPIVMQNYIGIGAVIHNKNNFGFFKVRGKFSF